MSQYPTRISSQNQAVHGIATYLMAIGCARLRPVELMILLIAFLKSIVLPRLIWNERKSRPVKLGGTMLGWSSYNINDINKSIVNLCECRVLSRESAGKYRIVVDWREWLMSPDGEPRIRPVCAAAITSLDWIHECPPSESSRIDSDEPAAAPTSDLPAPGADATGAILDDSGAIRAGAYREPADYAPAHRNGNCDACDATRLGRHNVDLQSYSSLQPQSGSHSFSSDVYVSSLMDDTTGNPETYIHQKKKNLWGPPNGDGVKVASMEPAPIANSTVAADPVAENMSPPAAPSPINVCPPASMLKGIPGDVVPDEALWADLEYMLNKFLPTHHYEGHFRNVKYIFPTAVILGALKRCLIKRKGLNNFSYILTTMRTWVDAEEEQHYDRDLRPIRPAAVDTPGAAPASPPAAEVDPYADLMANAPGMYGEWFKDHHVSMGNNPPAKGTPNGKFMDDADFNRRLALKARDPDRFVKLSMAYYCPSLILERES